MMVRLLPAAIVLLMTSVAGAQTPAAAPADAQPAVVDPQAPPVPPVNYTYSAEGRRDPFRSLVNTGVGSDARQGTGRRPEGVPGLAVNELMVRGILKTPDGFIAMVQAPNGRTYTVRPGDQLLDGRVRAITAEALIIMQEVNDPLSLEKQREVRKPLRGEG
jgi:Tfp pilus assembly protein PilP